MANPVDFVGSNTVLRAAPGTEEFVKDMHVYTNGREYISRWKLSDEERMLVAQTGDVWVSIAGARSPPSFVSGFPLMQVVAPDGVTVIDKYDPDNFPEPSEGPCPAP